MANIPRTPRTRKRPTPAAWWRWAVRSNIQARPRPIGKAAPRLAALLERAHPSIMLGDWQVSFCLDLAERFAERGEYLVLTPKQRAALAKIARRIGAAPL
jgi:hypothetical protein